MHSIIAFLETVGGRAVGFGIAYGLIFLMQIWRLDLLHQETLTFLMTLTAWFVIWILSVLNVMRSATWIAAAVLLWITLSIAFPQTARALRATLSSADDFISQAFQDVDEASATSISPAPEQDEVLPMLVPDSESGPHPAREVFVLTDSPGTQYDEDPSMDSTSSPQTCSGQDELRPVIERNEHAGDDELRPLVIRKLTKQ